MIARSHGERSKTHFAVMRKGKPMSDLISTQDAVAKVVDYAIRNVLSGEQKLTKEYEQSVKEAVNVILDTAKRTDGDLISRQAAIDAVLDRMNVEKYGRNAKPEEIQWALEKLPSAQPETAERTTEMAQNVSDGDLISRKAAMNRIDEALARVFKEPCGELILRKVPSAQPEQRWISCSERLPDEDYWTGANFQYSADVLMTVYNAEDEETIIDYGHTVDGSWYSDTTDCFVPSWWEVLAWMPLPEPYNEDDK